MSKRFENQAALVAGGADGLGKAIGTRLAAEGATVVLADKNEAKLAATVAELNGIGASVTGLPVDITDEEAVATLYAQVAGQSGRLDIMVNAAGIVGPTNTSIGDYPTAAFDEIYRVNLRGTFLMTKYAVAAMSRQNSGRILLIASIAGKEGNPNMVGYSATKAGVIGLVKAVGKEYATKGITVNGLAPAVIKTEMNADTAPEQLKYMTDKIPMGRLGTVEEVAAIATWIVSPEASFSTGFVFDISGGRATY